MDAAKQAAMKRRLRQRMDAAFSLIKPATGAKSMADKSSREYEKGPWTYKDPETGKMVSVGLINGKKSEAWDSAEHGGVQDYANMHKVKKKGRKIPGKATKTKDGWVYEGTRYEATEYEK